MDQWTAPTPIEREEMRRADAAVERARQERMARQMPRLVLHAHVTTSSEDNFFSGLTENISEGGVFVATFSPPGIGERIRLQLAVDDAQDFVVEAIVRWHRYDDAGELSGCGAQFVDLTPACVRRIQTLMLALPREPLLTDF